MKSVLLGIGAMVVVSVIAWAVMDTMSTSADEANISQNNSVRLN